MITLTKSHINLYIIKITYYMETNGKIINEDTD